MAAIFYQALMCSSAPICFFVNFINNTYTQGAIYRSVIGGYYDSGLRALMIQMCYNAILKHDLLRVRYTDATILVYVWN